MSDIFAAQIAAVANIVLAVFAIVTAIVAGLAFWKQRQETHDQAEMLKIQADQSADDRKVNAEQIRVLKLQAEELIRVADDREREAGERRRAQALQISMWQEPWRDPEPGHAVAHLRNSSQQPLYRVMIQWWPPPGPPYWTEPDDSEATGVDFGDLPPGKEVSCSSEDQGPYAMCRGSFQDRAGAFWHIYPDGRLSEAPGQ